MSSNKKVLLIIIAAVLGVALLIAGGAWYWWSRNSSEVLDAGATAMTEGQNSGRRLDEGGCMAAAFERHKTDGSQRITAAVRNSLWLTSCLEASKTNDKFCEAVPTPDNLIATGTWGGKSCLQQGFTDPYCAVLFGVVPKYCASATRAQKLKTGAESRPAG
jgi:hypothetical protein